MVLIHVKNMTCEAILLQKKLVWDNIFTPFFIQDLCWLLGVKEFMPSDYLVKLLGSTFCKTFTKEICSDIIFLFCGFDQKQLNEVCGLH